MVRPSALAVRFRDNASCVMVQIIFGGGSPSELRGAHAARYAVRQKW
jgi:hypothetical protein